MLNNRSKYVSRALVVCAIAAIASTVGCSAEPDYEIATFNKDKLGEGIIEPNFKVDVKVDGGCVWVTNEAGESHPALVPSLSDKKNDKITWGDGDELPVPGSASGIVLTASKAEAVDKYDASIPKECDSVTFWMLVSMKP